MYTPLLSGAVSDVSLFAVRAVFVLRPRGRVSWTQTLKTPPGGEPGSYHRFRLSKPVVGRNIAFHAAPADRGSDYLVSIFLIH